MKIHKSHATLFAFVCIVASANAYDDPIINATKAFSDLPGFVQTLTAPSQVNTIKAFNISANELRTLTIVKTDQDGFKVTLTPKPTTTKSDTDFASYQSIVFDKVDGNKHLTLTIDAIESKTKFMITTKVTEDESDKPPKSVITNKAQIVDGKITTREEEKRERQPNGQVKVTKNTYGPGGTELVKSIQTLEGAATPLNSRNMNVYTELAAGFAYSGAQRTNYFTTALVDGAGNPITRDGKQVYKINSSVPQATIATQLSGQISFAFGEGRQDKTVPDLRFLPFNKWGVTIGTGITSSTSGTFALAPYAGLSLFFGDNDTFVITGGVAWVPTTKLKGLAVGQEILSDQISTYESYSKATLFIGLSYRIGGSSGGSDDKKGS